MFGARTSGHYFRYIIPLFTTWGIKYAMCANITDVGHLVNDAGRRGRQVAKKAWLEQLSPAEVVQFYVNRYHKSSEALHPFAAKHRTTRFGTHHWTDWIGKKEILNNGYLREKVLCTDVAKYNKDHHYGKLSGRNLTMYLNTTRELDGQSEKRNPADFALEGCTNRSIMRYSSPWSNGFPDGIANVPPWDVGIWASILIFTEAAWILFSLTTNAK